MTADGPTRPDPDPVGDTAERRSRMVARDLVSRGIHDSAVLLAMSTVPRERFVPPDQAELAYEDHPLPIAEDQTISQPYIVAAMAEAAEVGPDDHVLEVGTGSGYQAAILAAVGLEVYTVERIGDLLRQARKRLRQLGMNVRSKHDDGRIGWPEHGPYDAIVVTAAAPALVEALVEQLAVGGRLVAPVGGPGGQTLLQLTRQADGIVQEELAPVSFVPLLSGMLD